MERRMTPRAALQSALEAIRGEPLVILISGNPDPDAIACAFVHQRLCESVGVPAEIAHVLGVSHRENRAMLKLLEIPMTRVTRPADLAAFKHLSLVDTSTPEPSIDLPAHLHLFSVVDHHRVPPAVAPFVDVRPNLGACATIYAEYLEEGFAPLEPNRREDARVATALLLALQTDTDDFTLATSADFRAAAYVRDLSDRDILAQIGRRELAAGAVATLGRAIAALQVVRNFALSGVGVVPLPERDTIGSAADFLLQREDIDTVIVFGIVGDRIDGSLRTNSASVDPATLLDAAFGRDPEGRPYGGGRSEKGGFQIPLGMLAECTDPAALWRLAEGVVRSRLTRIVPGWPTPRRPRIDGIRWGARDVARPGLGRPTLRAPIQAGREDEGQRRQGRGG